MITRISDILIKVDRVCDYTPFSPVTNLINLFQKVLLSTCLERSSLKNHYFIHLSLKSYARCFVLLIPGFGFIAIAIYDYIQYRQHQPELEKLEKDFEKLTKRTTRFLTNLPIATLHSGESVSPNKMPPAQGKQLQLWTACFGYDHEKVKQLLDGGVDPNFMHLGQSPLAIACAKGAEKVVELLLPKIKDINQLDPYGHTALMYGACSKNIELVRLLLDNGADKAIKKPNGYNAIFSAVESDTPEILDLLLTDQDPNQTFDATRKAGFAAFAGKDTTLLHHALLLNKKAAADYLIARQDVDVTLQDASKNTALHYAVKNFELTRALLNRSRAKAFIDTQNFDQYTALHYAIDDCENSAMLLVNNNASLYLKNKYQEDAWTSVCRKGKDNLIRRFLIGSFLSDENRIEYATICVKNKQYESAYIFLDYKDLFKRDVNLDALFYVLCKQKASEARDLLILRIPTQCLNIDRKNEDGETYLQLACQNGDLTLIDLLLERNNANPNVEDPIGWTPIHFTTFGLLKIIDQPEKFDLFLQTLEKLLKKTNADKLHSLPRQKTSLAQLFAKLEIFKDGKNEEIYQKLIDLLAKYGLSTNLQEIK